VYTLSSDQTVAMGDVFIGLGNQANNLDDVALPCPIAGNFTNFVLSIKQNIKMGVNDTPGPGERVDAYLVIVPYDGSVYGTPEVDATAVQNFLMGMTGALPIGSSVTALEPIGEGKQCSISTGSVPINQCDIFGVLICPIGFTSFKPSVTIIFGTT